MEVNFQRLNSSGERMLNPHGLTLEMPEVGDFELTAIEKFADENIAIISTLHSVHETKIYVDIVTADGERIVENPIPLREFTEYDRCNSISLHSLNNGREMVVLYVYRLHDEEGVPHEELIMQKFDEDGNLLLGESGISLSGDEFDVNAFIAYQTPNDRFWIMAKAYDNNEPYMKIIKYDVNGVIEEVVNSVDPLEPFGEMKLVGDGQGGAYAFYRGITERWEDGDLYYYHFDSEGTLLHPSYQGIGAPLSTAWYSQNDLVAASDGMGGVVAAWTDFRGSGGDIPEDDIYAMRVNDFAVNVRETEIKEIPLQWAIDSIYPNPFNPATTITYTIPAQARVTLRVFDLLGREVSTLVRSNQPAGRHQVV